MTIYSLTYIDANNTSGFNFSSTHLGVGSVFTPTETDITTLELEDDDGFLHEQGTDPGATPGTALNDPSNLGTTGYEVGEQVQYFSSYEVTGSDGSTGTLYYMSNYSGSGIQGVTSTIPFTAGVTYTVGAQVSNVPLPYETLAPCFVRGTNIATETGETPIENLSVGDLVLTKNGPRPIRWIGSTIIWATRDIAPILIRKGALGNHQDLRVSPQHRMLISGCWAELLFGENEVLVAAKALINDKTIIRVEGGSVEYFHILFDIHEIVFSEGIPSESFHPGEWGLKAFGHETREEIFRLFPELRRDCTAYGPSAHLSLTNYEAAVLGDAMWC